MVGNGWHDVERNFTVRGRWMDALIMLRHVFQEWIAPIGDDGNVDAFSYRQLVVPKMQFLTGFMYPLCNECLGGPGKTDGIFWIVW